MTTATMGFSPPPIANRIAKVSINTRPSGAGAKHQNGRAERAIQTIMYMEHTFMIHILLLWNECGSDDITLWPFAVQHAAWLYNRLPNQVSGLTPLEILTGTHSDHRDLLRTHVWGYPVYILDPQL